MRRIYGFLQSADAKRTLELSGNCAAYKHKLKILEGTTAIVGRMTSSNTIQFYFPDTKGLIFTDSTATDGLS